MEISDLCFRQDVFDAMELVRGRWAIAVLATLALGELQYKEILAEINEAEIRLGAPSHRHPLSDRVLSDTLRRLRDRALIERRSAAKQFGPVWYRLTPVGRSLLDAAQPLAAWAQAHRAAVRAPRSGV